MGFADSRREGLTLDVASGGNIVGQTDVSPCVIGPPNCQNPAGFAFAPAGSGGGGSIYDIFSPQYTVAQITGIAGGSFYSMLLDYNQADDAQRLNLFEAIYYNAGGEIGRQTFDVSTLLPVLNNGAGFSDFLITGFSIQAGSTLVQFHANWFNNDGADRYFIRGAQAPPCIPGVNCPTPRDVPEPTGMLLIGMGLAGAAARARRRAKQS